ncbi:MAG: hypothetical protein HUU02_14275 [Bacteroidetes bacterium]|nr:hypothetical protein [Bacteroidota bacterium]
MLSRTTQFLLTLLLIALAADAQTFTYRSPVPGSALNSRETNIILRSAEPVDAGSLQSDDLRVSGSRTGDHAGSLELSDDGHTILFHPVTPFAAGETVTVELIGEIRKSGGRPLPVERFHFTVTPNERPLNERYAVTDAGEVVLRTERSRSVPWTAPASLADPLPSDFPKFTVVRSSGASDGYFFLTTTDDVAGVGYFYYMVDNTGAVVKYQRAATSADANQKVMCGSFAKVAALGAKTDADAVAACRKSFDDCMAKPSSAPTTTDSCKDAYASLQKCKGTGTTVGDMNGCLTESTDQLVALASTDWCAGLKAGVVKTEPKAAMGPKCTAVQTKCPALWSGESTGGGATPPSGG